MVIGIVWSSVMSTVEWNKKEELVAEQAIKHLKQYSPLLAAFTTQGQSELDSVTEDSGVLLQHSLHESLPENSGAFL